MNLQVLVDSLKAHFDSLGWTSEIEVVDSLGLSESCLHVAWFNQRMLRVENTKHELPVSCPGDAILERVSNLLSFIRTRLDDKLYLDLRISQDGYFSFVLVQSRIVNGRPRSAVHHDFS